MESRIPTYMFILALALIFFVYYAGVATDVTAAKGFVSNVGNTFTGRNPGGGPFQAYPGNAPQQQAT